MADTDNGRVLLKARVLCGESFNVRRSSIVELVAVPMVPQSLLN